MSKFLVINSSMPEVDYAAAALSQVRALSAFVRRYVARGGFLEGLIAFHPRLKRAYCETIGLRRLPPGLETDKVVDVGKVYDLSAAFVSRILNNQHGRRLSWRLLHRRNAVISQSAAALASKNGCHIYANFSVAKSAFQRTPGLKILNYPTAHPFYIQRELAKEALRVPGFASSIGPYDSSQTAALLEEIQLADYIVLGSSFAFRTFQAEGVPTHKLLVCPYGTDLSRFSAPPRAHRSGPFTILFVGRLSQAKGIAYLITAVKRLIAKYSDVRLRLVGRMVGDGAWMKELGKGCEVMAHVPQPQLSMIYHEADAFVLPSLVEGMPLVVLEAMACSLPVIVTPNGPGDIVRDSVDGYIVPPRDADAIYDRLEQLYSNEDLCSCLGRNAAQRAREFTWEAFQGRLLEHLRSVGALKPQ